MGFLKFLNRRASADTNLHQRGSTTGPQDIQGISTMHIGTPKTLEELRRSSGTFNQSRLGKGTEFGSSPLKPRLVSVSEARPSTAQPSTTRPNTAPPKGSAKLRPQLKSTGRNPEDFGRSLTPNLGLNPQDRHLLNGPPSPSLPLSPGVGSAARQRSGAFVDLLDAQGEIKPYDFRSRIQASGTRDYGEDVADRNMRENGADAGSPVLSGFPGRPGSSLSYRSRGSVSAASYRNNVADIIPELQEDSGAFEEPVIRPYSRQRSIRGSPKSAKRLSAISTGKVSRAMSIDAADSSTDEDLQGLHHKPRTSCGRISVTGFRAPTPQQPPKTSAGPYMRDECKTFQSDSRSASPPGVPRYKPRQLSLPVEQGPSRPAHGSVRLAREALMATPAVAGDESMPLQARCDTPVSPTELHYFQKSAFGGWGGFDNRTEYPSPSTPTREEANGPTMDDPRAFPFGTISPNSRTRLDEIDKPSVPVPRRRHGSISSFAPSDYSSPRFTVARSIRTADASADVPHSQSFKELKSGGFSSRSVRSRGGDNYIVPDSAGFDEESCGDSIFISPATPVKDQSKLPLLTVGHLEGGLSAGYESASIYDSDNDSFREKRLQVRPDGEALLFTDKGFGVEGHGLPGLFEEVEISAAPKWPDMPITPTTDVSDMGDDEDSLSGPTQSKPRQRPIRPFTQRERLLALGYDYDSDSDVEASVDADEMPEERALMLLTALAEASTTLVGDGSNPTSGQHRLDMNTIAKLRKEIKKRKLLGPASRRGSRISTPDVEREAEISATN